MNKILSALFGISDESGEATHADVIDLLKEDHQKVKDLFEEFEALDSSESREKRRVLKKIFAELAIHTQLEEELVYPLVEHAQELVNEAREEHHVVDLIIAEIKKARSMNEKTDAKVKVLKEMVEHHIEEEETEMFQKLPSEELQEIGARVKVRKEELLGKEFPEKKMEHAGVQPVEELYGGSEMGSESVKAEKDASLDEKQLPEIAKSEGQLESSSQTRKDAKDVKPKRRASTPKRAAAKTTAKEKAKKPKRTGKKRSAA